MGKHILYCKKCSEYTMHEACPRCGSVALSNKPAKFSPEDKWGKYRLKYKEEQEKQAQ